MKSKLTIFSITAILFLFLGYSCSSDDYLSDREIQQMIDNSLNGQWKVVFITVKASDWEWVSNPAKNYKGYYAATADLPELTENIFDEGLVAAYYLPDNFNKSSLPYVQTFDYEFEEGGKTYDGTYTEHISCDYTLDNPSFVTFIIEASNRKRFDESLEDRDFQIVLIW